MARPGKREGDIQRYVRNHGEKIELLVLPELKWALEDEQAHAIRDLGDTEPKGRETHNKPSVFHLVNDILHAYFLQSQEWRDEFRRQGKEDRREHQRSAKPVKIDRK